MPTTSSEISRAKLQHPDLNHDGGAGLHGKVALLLTALGDNANSRYEEWTGIGNGAFVVHDHNLGSNLDNLNVVIFSGTGATKSLILDTVAAGYAIAEEAGQEKLQIRITAPGAGGPHAFTAVVIDGELKPWELSQLLATAPANASSSTIRAWKDSNGRGLTKTATGVIGTQQTLTPIHSSAASVTALPGFHYLLDTTSNAITITLPATIADYDRIKITDATKNFNVLNCTVARNTNSIDGDAADVVMNFAGDWLDLTGDNTNSNWIADKPSDGQSAAGEGGTNYFENGSFENDATTGIAVGIIGGGLAPTFGEDLATPLYGTRSSKITSAAGTGFADYNIGLIDTGVVGSQIVTQISAHLKTDAAVADGDWTVGVWDSVGAAYVVAATPLIADTINIYRTPFVPLFVTADRYKLRVEFTDTTAGRILIADKLGMTPDNNSSLVAFEQRTNEVNLTITPTGVTGFSLIYATGYATKDANGAYRLIFNINANHDADSSFILAISGIVAKNIAAFYQNISVITGNTTTVTRAHTNPGSANIDVNYNVGETQTRLSGNILLDAKPDFFDANLDNNKINLLTQDVVTANSFYSASVGITASVTAGNPIILDTVVTDQGGGFTNSGGVLTCNFTGIVDVSATMYDDGGSFSILERLGVALNGTVVGWGADGNGSGRLLSVDHTLAVTKGDTLSIECSATFTVSASTTFSFATFTRRADYGAFSPVGFALATPTVAGLVYKVVDREVDNTSGVITTTSTSLVDVPGMSVTVVLPIAGIIAFSFTSSWTNTATSTNYINVELDGTTLLFGSTGIAWDVNDASFYMPISLNATTDVLPAGSHTLQIQWRVGAGQGSMQAFTDRTSILSAWAI